MPINSGTNKLWYSHKMEHPKAKEKCTAINMLTQKENSNEPILQARS